MALSTPEAAEMQAADLRENGPYPSLGVNTLLDMYTGKISMAAVSYTHLCACNSLKFSLAFKSG